MFIFSDTKSQSSLLNHVSNSLLVNSLSSSSNNTSVVNSVSAHTIGNPSLPTAPLINSLLMNNHVSLVESSTSPAVSATNNSSVITSLTVSQSTPSQANAVNSSSENGTKADVPSLSMVMNGPTNAGGSFHQVSSIFIQLYIQSSPDKQLWYKKSKM